MKEGIHNAQNDTHLYLRFLHNFPLVEVEVVEVARKHEDDVNVKRRLRVFTTKTMPKWMFAEGKTLNYRIN